MADMKVETSGGIGVIGLLGVAFVILKLCSVIDWPWIWVLSPFWIPVGIFVAVLIIAGLLYLGITVCSSK